MMIIGKISRFLPFKPRSGNGFGISFRKIFVYPVTGVPGIVNYFYGSEIAFPDDVNEPYVCTQDSLKGPTRHNWMKGVDSLTPVSLLSLPGTHNTGTYTCSRHQFIGINKTQSLTVKDQLQAGIRFLDLRIRLVENELRINHGPFAFGRLADIVVQIKMFLEKNPSEFIIVSFQGDEEPDISGPVKNEFNNLGLPLFMSKDAKSKKIPTVQELRGKVWALGGSHVKLDSQTYAFHLKSDFQDNENVYIQNFCRMSGAHDCYDIGFAQKWAKVNEGVFDIKVSPSRMKINYLNGSISQSHIVEKGIEKYFPFEIARSRRGPNNLLHSKLKNRPNAKLGVIVMDFPGDELIGQIISTNKLDQQ